ncbi:G patch domain-containing protein 1 [Lamellibrachia satsuma]|nr:G patch domain-containing protein 1 [Lamellibrachia satsuma]
MNSDEDEDTFVTIGTPLEPYEEDEVVKKPTRVQDQTAHDSKGRRRFHGAFTGGFSAGYFNTVGSEQGWAPSTFVSSRSKKSDAPASRHPENYMDDEDLGDHGIAPRNVAPTEDFASASRKRNIGAVTGDGVIPGASPLEDIIVPAKCPIGVRLLRKLGWKEGQGVGPRVRRKARRRKQSAADSGQKVYGCSLPPANNEDGESDEDEYAEGITFAPKDVNPISFTPKDNLHGIGYHGIDPKTALSGSSGHVSLFEPSAVTSSGKKGITGQAFGIGAFEDEDDDIYTVDHLSNYDRVLGGPEKDKLHGWTAPRHRGDSTQLAIGNVAAVLENFKLASTKCQPKKVYPPPHLPRDFRPYHAPSTAPGATKTAPPPGRRTLDANVRGLMLGEMPRMSSTASVFDILATQKTETPKLPQAKISFTLGSATPQMKTEATQVIGQSPLSREHQPLATASSSTTPLSSTSAGFQPFARTPEKQSRYEKFLELRKQGKADTYEEYARKSLTEWESRQEAAEFARAAQLYRPLCGTMATRFTKARFDDTVSSAELPEPEQGPVSAQQKAAEMKLFGKLTRETTKWRPDKLLCKRFNVPNPYPDETAEVRKVKREKFSIFNFLSAPPQPESTNSENAQESAPVAAIEPPMSSVETTETIPVKTEADKADSVGSGATESKTQPTDGARPPMDLFKAIFGDSSNSDSSDSEMDQDIALRTPTDAVVPSLPDAVNVTEPPPPSAAADMEISNGTIPIEAVAQRLDPSVGSSSVTTPDDDEKASIPFGPALPPPPTAEGQTQSSGKTSRKHRHKDKKHKHKSRKKKKSRHKKHKKQQKKHRTKSDSDSEWDTEDSNDDVPTDTQLLNKLRSLLPGQRTSINDI